MLRTITAILLVTGAAHAQQVPPQRASTQRAPEQQASKAAAPARVSDPNARAAQTARQVGQQARGVARYAENVAHHYDGFAGQRPASPGAHPYPAAYHGPEGPRAYSAEGSPEVRQRQLLVQARQGIVRIERMGQVLGLGTVLANDGRILTALSNLTHGNDLDVRFADGSISRVQVGHTDRGWDLALLVPQNGRWMQGLRASKLPPQEAGTEARVFTQQPQGFLPSRAIIQGRTTLLGGDSTLLTDAVAIASNVTDIDIGTPVLDHQANVMAIIARACAPAPETAPEGTPCTMTPYGVPVSAVRAFLRVVPESAVPPAPWLGIRGVADQVGPVNGVRLVGIEPNSPAAAAGLRGAAARDASDVIVAVNGKAVTSPEELARVINEHGVGDSVHMLVFGNGMFRELSIGLRAAPDRVSVTPQEEGPRAQSVIHRPPPPVRVPAPAPAPVRAPGHSGS